MSPQRSPSDDAQVLAAHTDGGATQRRFKNQSSSRLDRRANCGLVVAVVLVLHAALLTTSAAVNAPIVDEPFHLAGGVRHWQSGKFDIDRGNPPLVGTLAAIPVVAVGVKTDWKRAPNSFCVGVDFMSANGARSFWLMRLARWALVPLSVWGGFVCYLWARELGGERSGVLALILWCFCPQVIALGSVVTGDMAATVLGLTTLFVFWRWLRTPSWNWAMTCGIVWGLAEASKYVCLWLFPFCIVSWLAWRLSERRDQPWRTSMREEAWQGLAMVLISINVINMSYLFDGFGQPLNSFRTGRTILEFIPLSIVSSWLQECPVPLPADYVGGFEEVANVVSNEPKSYLRGEHRTGGWWYYYLYGWMVKLPLGTWCVIGVACGLYAWKRFQKERSPDPKSSWLVCSAIVAILVLVTTASGLQFLRYSLPALPFVLILASQVVAGSGGEFRWLHRAIAFSVTWSVASSLFLFPHSLSYFNELAGGPEHGEKHLIDDSYDWGQDLLELSHWIKLHPEARPLKLAYFGLTDPRAAGIQFELPPRMSELIAPATDRSRRDLNARAPNHAEGPVTRIDAGWYAISIGLSHGLAWSFVHDGEGHEIRSQAGDFDYLDDVAPVDSAGYSIRIFHLDEQAAARITARIQSEGRSPHVD